MSEEVPESIEVEPLSAPVPVKGPELAFVWGIKKHMSVTIACIHCTKVNELSEEVLKGMLTSIEEAR